VKPFERSVVIVVTVKCHTEETVYRSNWRFANCDTRKQSWWKVYRWI